MWARNTKMAESFETFKTILANLKSNEDKLPLLSVCRMALMEIKSTTIRLIFKGLQLDILFDCLNSSVKEEVDLTCEILDISLSCLQEDDILEQYKTSIQRALCHPTTTVKKMMVKQLQGILVHNMNLLNTLTSGNQLLEEVVLCVGHEDMSLSNYAIKFLVNLGQTPNGINMLYSKSIIYALKNVMVQDDIYRFRIYEIVTAVSESSELGLEANCVCGLLPELLLELQDDNVLIQLNALELITKLALTEHGLAYLEERGVITSLADNLISCSDDPLASVLQPGYIKFFGNMAQSRPQQITQYSNLAMALFDTLDSPDVVLLGVVMETIGYIASSVEGKFSLQNLGDTMPTAMRKLGILMNNLPTEVRVRVLNTIANIVELKVADQNEESLSLVKSWFQKLGREPMYSIMIICRQPFPELKLAALQVVQSVADQPWGQQCINDTAGLLELLLNRSMENTKVCKDAKHRIVQTLATSPTAEDIFSSETLAQLRDFTREGPCFVHSVTEIAIEGAM